MPFLIADTNMNTAVIVLLAVSVLLVPSSSELCHPEDKSALLRIKASLNNPPLLSSWQLTTDCCNWSSIFCDLTTHRIVSLFLEQADLPVLSPIPPAIGDLPYLEDLTLNALTNLTRPVPTSLLRLKHLKYITFTDINLSGPVPAFLSHLRNLRYINFFSNQLTGSIPSSLSRIPKLRYIGLDRNLLTGTIPPSLSSLKGNLLYLVLADNDLSGEIPQSFGDVDFGYVDLSGNRLRGDASFLFGKDKRAEKIDLSRNRLQFNLSGVQVYEALTSLDLRYNKIYGEVPEGMAGLELDTFNVSYNRLCGRIPVGGNLQSIGYSAYLHNRCLCGDPLPPCKTA
ncbi:hypothetical protein MLD38_031044 [Melastoma candidum]|uniref:Uncharacterized protein n=1 Tax=Melastoma candidum TaxID=119954 RepID=A0ACB9MNI7_9MYRT|nr:hypothetical protein MLD38_031044 [Melastoma candidum]